MEMPMNEVEPRAYLYVVVHQEMKTTQSASSAN